MRLLDAARLSFGAVVVLAPLSPRWVLVDRPVGPLYPEFTGAIVYLSDGAVLLTLLLWVAALVAQPQSVRRLSPGPWLLTGPLVALVGLTYASLAWAQTPTVTAEVAGRSMLLLGLYLFAANNLADRGGRQLIAGAFVVGAAAQSAVAILQWVRQAPVGLAMLGELPVTAAGSGPATIQTADALWLRPYGLSTHPNLLAGFLLAGLFGLAGFWLEVSGFWFREPGSSPNQKPQTRNQKPILVLVLTALVSAGLAVTFSRSAWLALAVGLAVLLGAALADRRRLRAVLAFGAVTALSFGVVAAFYPDQFSTRLWFDRLRAVAEGPLPRPLPAAGRGDEGGRPMAEDAPPSRGGKGAGGLGLPPAGETIAGFLSAAADDSARGFYKEQAAEVIAAWPWGVGAGGYTIASYRLRPNEQDKVPIFVYLPVHDVWLLARAELGPAGPVVLTAAFLGPLLALVMERYRSRADPPAPLAPRGRGAVWIAKAAKRREKARTGGLSPTSRMPLLSRLSRRFASFRGPNVPPRPPSGRGARDEGVLFAWAAVWCGLIAVGFFDYYPLGSQPGRLLWWLLASVIAATVRQADPDGRAGPETKPPRR